MTYKVLIIESRSSQDKKNERSEQDVLGSVFKQLGINAKVQEVDTKKQFFRALKFAESEHIKYVHFSGHGAKDGISIGDDCITWEEIDKNCWPSLKNTCLSFSSCDVAKGVEELYSHKTFCAAIVAATRPVTWPESAVAFSAFFLRATDPEKSTEQDVRVMNHICGPRTFKLFRAPVCNSTHVLS
jgi:hypothetical protein